MAVSRETIVQAALAVLDEGGIAAVTVRAVAGRLGVKAPALYWHVKNKQELLDEMGTEIQRRIARAAQAAGARGSWADQLCAYARATRAEYLRHRDGARTFSGTRVTDVSLLQAQEDGLARWVQQGVTVAQNVAAFELVTAFTVGFAIEEQERAQSDPGRYDLAARDARVGPDHPLALEAGHYAFGDPDERFEGLLSVLIAGIELRLR